MEASKLASYVASRLCHDLAAPLTPLMQSCEMLFDDSMGAAMKAEGEKALKQSIATLEAPFNEMDTLAFLSAIESLIPSPTKQTDLPACYNCSIKAALSAGKTSA